MGRDFWAFGREPDARCQGLAEAAVQAVPAARSSWQAVRGTGRGNVRHCNSRRKLRHRAQHLSGPKAGRAAAGPAAGTAAGRKDALETSGRLTARIHNRGHMGQTAHVHEG